jgi:hypothetical protein
VAGTHLEQGAGDPPGQLLLTAIAPLIDRIGATVVDPAEISAGDVPITWDGAVIAGIRLSAIGSASTATPNVVQPARSPDSAGTPETENATGLDGLLADLATQFGAPLAGLPRPRKQEAVRMLEENGAFSYRKSVETVAAALGISRFTVYNYLNRDRG